jgi:hypothetical protein
MELVRWVDSIRHADGWQSLEHYVRESERSMECETVGFVVHGRDDSLIVASSRMVGAGGAITEVIQIPLVAVLERVPLQEKKRKGWPKS